MKTEKAYLAGGCFWCLEASYNILPGVIGVVSGYAGGALENPTYDQVTSGLTGHAETVEITYNPQKVSYQDLLKLFFILHDPSQKDGQGADIGSQYRSAIFFTNKNQGKISKEKIEELKKIGKYPEIYTEILPINHFWPAEEYHQNYFEKHPEQAYCQAVIRPKIDKVNKYLKGQ